MTSNVWNSLVHSARDAVHVERVSLWEADMNQGLARLLASSHHSEKMVKGQEVRLSQHDPIITGLWQEGQYHGPATDHRGYLYARAIRYRKKATSFYILSFYQSTDPVSAGQVHKAGHFVELVQALTKGYTVRLGRLPVNRYAWAFWRTEERVRQEIAEILHGPVQSRLLILEKQVADVKRRYEQVFGQSLSELAVIEEQLQRLREDDVRQLSHRLHPDLIRVGLGPALRVLQSSYELCLDVRLAMSPRFLQLDSLVDNRISPSLRLGLYRIVEEALNNVVRHGKAQHVVIFLDYDPDQGLWMKIQDDGDGFVIWKNEGEGMGMRMMKMRAKHWGGSLSIVSKPLEGTSICVTIPPACFLIDNAAAASYESHLGES